MANELFREIVGDGLYADRWTEEDGKVYRVREQRNRAHILAANQLARALDKKRPDGLKWALRIPEDDYGELVRRNPDLLAPDKQIRDAAWRKFIASAESLPYRVWDQPAGRSA